MALTVSGFSSANLTYKLAYDDNISATSPGTDVFGSSGTIHGISITNSESSNTAYLKMKITSGTVTVGTTQPDLMFQVTAGKSTQIDFPAGLKFTQLSYWVTVNAVHTDTTDPGTIVASFLCS